MAHVNKGIEIQSPLSEVFSYVADYRNALEWMVGFSEFTPLTESASGLGSRVRVSGRLIGFTISTVLEIVEFVENERFTSLTSEPILSRTTWTFAATPRGTLVTFSGDYVIHGLPVPILGDRILGHEVASHTVLSLRHLRRILERRAGSTPTRTTSGEAEGIEGAR